MRRIRAGLGALAVVVMAGVLGACPGGERPAGDSVGRIDTTAPGPDTPVDTTPVDTNVVVVTGPTVVAAFPITEAEASRSTALGEALENFQRHLDSAGDSLRAHGVTVRERYGSTVHWRFGDTITSRQVPPDRPLYVLLSPATGEQFLLGVQTDSALFVQAMRHFGGRE